MRVKDLIEYLKEFDAELEVKFSYGYGDYWHTEVAADVGRIDMGFVKFSDYHRMDQVVEPDYDEEPEDGLKAVVLIS